MSITSVQILIATLEAALHQPDQRAKLIDEFQRVVFNTPEDMSETWEWEILRDLAYDLEFYEPDIDARAEDPSYFGDELAEEEIRSALEKLEGARGRMGG